MFKLESFVTPLLANYLNKYIKDLKADDLQLSLWKGEAVLNNLDLRLDAIEHDLGLPVTFISGNIQELRIKVPWTRLTTEPVVISVNTMECLIRLSSPSRAETPSDWEHFGRPKVSAPPSVPPPPGYMESLSTRVLNNVRIQFTNLILRYVEDDFILTVLVKNADYFTVNERWEKWFVEVSQPDLCLRRVLTFHDLHISLSRHSTETKTSFPLVERTFVTCRFLTKFDGSDCRAILATVINVLCDELHVCVTDSQLPMVRRLVDLAIAFQAGVFNSRLKRSGDSDFSAAGDSHNGDLFAGSLMETPVAPPTQNSSWTSWALSLIPAIPSDPDVDTREENLEDVRTSKSVLPKASTFAAYARKLTVAFALTETSSTGKGGRPLQRPILRLEIEDALVTTKSREAKFSSFRAALGMCQLIATNECPCGENGTINAEASRPILSFNHTENPLSERSKLFSGSLFGSVDDETESFDSKAPFESMDSYLSYNSESNLLQTYGVLVADSASVIEVPEDYTGNLSKLSENELTDGSLKQSSCLRVVVSPLLLLLDSAAFHRYQHFMQWFNTYAYLPYDTSADPTRSPSPTLQNPQILMGYVPMKNLHISVLKPTVVVIPPSHPSLQPGLGKKKVKMHPAPADLPALVIQAERFDFRQTTPLYPARLLDAAENSSGLVGESLRNNCLIRSSLMLSSAEATLCIWMPRHPPFRDVRSLIFPLNVEYSLRQPVDKLRCQRLWGELDDSTITCPGLHLVASLPELLLTHFCLSGLLQDIGSFVAHRTFKALAESVFDRNIHDDNLIRVDLKCGKIFAKLAVTNLSDDIVTRLASLELSLLIGDSSQTLMSTVLKNRPSISHDAPSDASNKGGSMRISAYNICLRRISGSKKGEVKYALHLPITTKLTVYPNFVNRFIENVGVSVQYQRDFSNVSLYREMSLVPTTRSAAAASPVLPKAIFELHHEKVSLDFLDESFEHLTLCVHSGILRLTSQHANIASYEYELRALLINLGRTSRDACIGPVSGRLQFEAFGSGDSVASFVTGDVSLLPLRLGALTLTSVKKVLNEIAETYKSLKNSLADQHSSEKPNKRLPLSLKVIDSQDDLRMHQWDYCQISSISQDDTVPDVNQVRFCESRTDQTMTWRYPELRTISSAAIIPIPFQVSPDGSDARQEIICSLQYLKRPSNTFVDLRSFTLMESKECMFRFPDVIPEDFDRLAISDVWRVKVSYSIQEESSQVFPISVLSLAGCMKINSGIIVGVPSSLHLSFSVGVVSLGLIHHVPVLAKTPGHSLISGFSYDNSYPSDQEFCRVKLDKVSLQARIVGDEDSSKITVESNFWMESDFVNYRFLTVQPLMEACFFACNFSYVTEDKVFIQAKLDSKTPLVFHCGQNVVHTFSMAYLAWKMALKEEYPSLPIMNHIVICNDTCHVVRIRQYTTDECIYIKPKEMHPYSWRSQRADQKLQFSVETYPNLWSEACPVALGSKLCAFPTAEDLELGLVCSVRALNNIQKQVVLATQFVVANQLNFDIEVQLYTEPDYVSNPLIEMAQEAITFSAGVASSTRCVPVEKIKRYRVRRKAGVWSESVSMSAKSEHTVIKVPMVSGSSLDVWSSLSFPVAPPGSRLLVFSSVLCGKNHLPYAIHIEIDCGTIHLQENIIAHDLVHFSLLQFVTEDCNVRISKIGSDTEAQLLKINLPKVLASMPPRAFSLNCADLIGETDATSRAAGVMKGKKQNVETSGTTVATCDYILEFERQAAYTDTLLFHVKPNGTRITSDYGRDLVLYGEDEELITVIPRKGASVLPSSSKGQVRLGVQNTGTIYLSDHFDIRPSQTAREPMMDCTGMGVLPNGGFIVVTFWEKMEDQFLIHHLTLRLTDEDSVYTLNVTSRFSAFYASDDLEKIVLCAFVAPKLHSKMDYPTALRKIEQHGLSASMTSRSAALSPFVYLVPANHPIEMDPNRATDLLTYVCIASPLFPHLKWSFPRQIQELKNKKSGVVTLNAPLPSLSLGTMGLCCKVTVVEDMGVCHLLIQRTNAPNLVFRNNCPYPLTFGECVNKGPGFVTFEEREAFIPLPVVEPGSVATYSYPSRDEEFPRVSTTALNYLLRIGRIIQTGSSNQTVVWSSTSVDAFTATNDRFVSIPGMCYLKLHFDRQNRRTIHVIIEPLSRVATPIQSASTPAEATLLLVELGGSGGATSSGSDLSISPLNLPFETTVLPLNVGISCVLKSVIFTLDDEISNPELIAEVLRLSVDDVSVQFYCDGQTTRTYECALNINDLQLDNQLYSCGFFDFPVILTKENPTKNVQSSLNILCKLNSETLAPENIHVSIAPMACFVEDTLAFHLLRLIDTFLAPALLVAQSPLEGATGRSDMEHGQRLLKSVIPVVIERIHIAPLEVYLSVHAALKMFVALNQTPLSFNEIDCNDVNSTATEVLNFIMQHYIRGTLLRAGWVIGSMDLLGNPATLLRSLTSGCGDLFVRPFSSLHAGPVSFLQGLARGASSCMAGISAGTISSVTNLAESVSRNLDWVSLDDQHVLRRMEVKYRHHPDGLASGLKQGLTGFAMSLLGAVAGLIDQPLQAVLQPSLTPTQFLTALMLGITKGVVGAMSKPIAGAAGLVSQTGQGILKGHGMLNFPPRRFVALSKPAAGFVESTLKYIWKVAPLLPNTVRTLCVVQAVPVVVKDTELSSADPVCLFLTDGALFVISSADDEFRQAYSLSKLNIRISRPLSDPHSHNTDLMQVTLLIEADSAQTNPLEDLSWPWEGETSEPPASLSPSHSWNTSNTHFTKESFLLEWKDAKLFQELFLVAKSDV